jgi:hypothetical protein
MSGFAKKRAPWKALIDVIVSLKKIKAPQVEEEGEEKGGGNTCGAKRPACVVRHADRL